MKKLLTTLVLLTTAQMACADDAPNTWTREGVIIDLQAKQDIVLIFDQSYRIYPGIRIHYANGTTTLDKNRLTPGKTIRYTGSIDDPGTIREVWMLKKPTENEE